MLEARTLSWRLKVRYIVFRGCRPRSHCTRFSGSPKLDRPLSISFALLGATLCGIFLTPVFYYVLQWAAECGRPKQVPAAALTGSGNPSHSK